MKVHVSDAKKQVVKEFVQLAKEYPIIATVNMENLPAKQLQRMRETLRDTVVLRMTKRRLILKIFEQAEADKKGISELTKYLKGMPALLFTKENPFTLYKNLKKNKSKAPIKAGQTAPNDIVVPAGPTGFAPGPIIGELGGFGIKSGIEDGKVVIKADSQVAKEGDVISAGLAGVLTRLGIEPMEIGLDLTAAYEDGSIFTKDVLDVDEEAFLGMVAQAASEAINLSFNTGYPTKETAELMLRSAAADALALALECNITTDETTKLLLAKAEGQAAGVAGQLPDEALGDAAKAAKSAATAAPATTGASSAPAEKPQEKKEEKKPEEAAAGLGSLFG